MSDFDLANCIRLFKHEDNQNSEQHSPDYCAIIPVEEHNVFQAINQPKNNGEQYGFVEDWNDIFPKEGIDQLIEFRTELEDLFSDCGNVLGIGAVLWNEIACRLCEKGINVSGKQCFNKWNSLYSEYLKTAMSENEGEISNLRNFARFEEIYKVRSNSTNSRIKSENSPSMDEIVNILRQSKNSVETHGDRETEKDFTFEKKFTETGEEDCQTSDYQVLKEMIKTAENLLDEDIKKEEELMEEVKLDVVKMKKSTCANKTNSQGQDSTWNYYSRGKCRNRAKVKGTEAKPKCATVVNSKQNDVNRSSEKVEFCWNEDATQCLIDLRLHVESSYEVKTSIVARYKSIGKFLSQKMLSNGWEISENDCKKKWINLIRCYNKEAKNLKTKAIKNDHGVPVSEYFYEIDKVMKKSERFKPADELPDFNWTEESVRTLIGIRIEMESAFSMFKKYIILWQYVATQMAKKNFFPTYNECSMKWIELREYYDFCFNAVRIGLLKKEEIGWKFFLDMYHAFEQNVETSKSIIEYPKVKYSAQELKSLGIIEKKLVQSSTAPALVDVFKTATAKKVSTSHGQKYIEDRKALDSPCAKAEIGENWLGVNEVPIYNVFSKSELNCEKKCKCSKFTWTRDAVLSLLGLRVNKELKFKNVSPDNIDLWKYIAAEMQSIGYNVCHESCKFRWYNLKVFKKTDEVNYQKYSVESEAPKLLPLKQNADATAAEVASIVKSNMHDSLKMKSRCVWDKLMITILIELKFSKEIRDLKNYGQPIAIRMQAAGYRDVTPSDCTRKWMSLRKSYNRCLARKITRCNITWQYFELINKHVENLVSEVELGIKNENSSLVWLPDCVRDLIQLKLLHPEVFVNTEATCELNESKDAKVPADNNVEEIVEQPVNFSCVKSKRKVDEEFEGGTVVKKLSTDTEHGQQVNRVIQMLDEDMKSCEETAVIDLSTKVLGPFSEQNSAQNVAVSNNCKAYFNNPVDVAKENFVCFVLDGNTGERLSEENFGRRESTESKILCNQKPCNKIYSANGVGNNQAKAHLLNEPHFSARFKYDVPIQDWSVNSTQIFKVEKKGEWDDAATDLLTDLRIEHERKFPFGYSEKSEILWEKIAGRMATMGYNFTRAECWKKWCSLRQTYENKIADIKENRVIDAWPYFGKLDSIYKKLGRIYKGFKWISPKKRTRDVNVDDNELRGTSSLLPNNLIISVLPSNPCCGKVSIPDAKSDALEKKRRLQLPGKNHYMVLKSTEYE